MTDIERLIDQFLAYIDVERGLAKATVRAYDSDLRKYNGWLATQGIQDLNAVTTQDVERYIAFLDDSGESARSKARRLASIHAFHRFALNEHVVSNDVAAQVKAPKGATTLPDVLTVDEVPVCWTRSPSRRIGLNPKAWRTCPTIPRCCATRRCWNSCTPPEPACRKRAARILTMSTWNRTLRD